MPPSMKITTYPIVGWKHIYDGDGNIKKSTHWNWPSRSRINPKFIWLARTAMSLSKAPIHTKLSLSIGTFVEIPTKGLQIDIFTMKQKRDGEVSSYLY
jgi:hypothetical protein